MKLVKAKWKNLRAVRVANGDSQAALGEVIGVKSKCYSQKERGITPFTIDECKKLAERYGKTLDELFS